MDVIKVHVRVKAEVPIHHSVAEVWLFFILLLFNITLTNVVILQDICHLCEVHSDFFDCILSDNKLLTQCCIVPQLCLSFDPFAVNIHCALI